MRIAFPQTVQDSAEAARPLLEQVKARFGKVPNIFRLVGVSPAALEGLLGLQTALARGVLDAPTRERIALAVANVNGCDYCNAAHTLGAKAAGLDAEEIERARSGRSADPRSDAAAALARAIAVTRGQVSDEDVEAARTAGLSDEEIVEVVAHVGLNVLTNYVNEALRTPLDFPAAGPARRAA